jgi:hypothetical protein
MELGIKHDQHKPNLGFFLKSFPNALKAASLQNDFGAKKYSPLNWKKVENERYENALTRHLLQALENPKEQDESGQYHLAAVIWNALALYEKQYSENNNE